MASIAVVSFRLGGDDGVSIEAAKWIAALRLLGHRITTVAGSGPVDVLLPGLGIDAPTPPTRREISDALAGADLVIEKPMLGDGLLDPINRLLAGAG